jgi:hypothetical protein
MACPIRSCIRLGSDENAPECQYLVSVTVGGLFGLASRAQMVMCAKGVELQTVCDDAERTSRDALDAIKSSDQLLKIRAVEMAVLAQIAYDRLSFHTVSCGECRVSTAE